MIGAVKRFALDPRVRNFLRPALADAASGKITSGSVLGRFAPDLVFGGLAASQTPGDAGDKAIAGIASGLGGGLGGAAVTAATRGKLGMVGELLGGYGGDMAGMQVGDAVMRLKGGGQTPYEKMAKEDQMRFAEALEQQILSQYGLLPGTREQYLNPGGLGTGGIG